MMSLNKNRLGTWMAIVAAVLCVAVALTGPIIPTTASEIADDDVLGCYVFDRNLYTNPLSSFMAYDGMPDVVYELQEGAFIITNTESGDIQNYAVQYCQTPVGVDEFSSRTDLLPDWLPDLTRYGERYLLAVMSDESGQEYGLYRMDDEIWLVELKGAGVWSIYRLKRTETTTLTVP